MTDGNSENDKNRELARKLGQYLEERESMEKVEDSLLKDLYLYKNRKDDEMDSSLTEAESQKTWEAIVDQIDLQPGSSVKEKKESRSLSILSSTTLRWAAAAIVVIGALVSYYYFGVYQQPELIASSYGKIEKVTLTGGSTATLRPHTRLYKISVTRQQSIYRLKGEALFRVTLKPGRTFTVETNRTVTSVLGTRFTLSTWGSKTRLFVVEGRVRFKSKITRTSAVVNSGQSAIISENIPSPNQIEAVAGEYTDWLDNQISFESREAGEVFTELEHHFSITIKAPTKVRNKRITGQLSLDSLNNALRDLGLALGGSFRSRGKQTYIYESEK